MLLVRRPLLNLRLKAEKISCIVYRRLGEANARTMTEQPYVSLTEGRATVLFPSENEVFYNPVQQFNRDLSISVIKAWSAEYLQEKGSKRSQRKKQKTRKGQTDEEEKRANSAEMANRPGNAEDQEGSAKITILEALSATGLRAIRYALEIPNVNKVIANDFSPSAVEAIKRNIENNPGCEHVVVPSQGDANAVMYAHKEQPFHCIDLDPYGTAAPFVDAAVQSIASGGLLLVTCTDLSILAGSGYPEKCFTNYGGMTCRSEFSHESALRLVLSMLSTSAGRYGRTIEPLLSLSIDFYVRLFIRVRTSPVQAKLSSSKTMVTYTCSGCGATSCQPLGRATPQPNNQMKFGFSQGPPIGSHCDYCGFVHHIGGPMWGGSLHNRSFIAKVQEVVRNLDERVYKTTPRIQGMLSLAAAEIDVPFYFTPSHLSGVIHSSCPPMATYLSALLNAGYIASSTHALPGAIKTNAPWSFRWDVMREWLKANPVVMKNIKDNTPAHALLRSLEPSHKIDLTIHPEADTIQGTNRKSKLIRYQQNPLPNWGPKAKATGDRRSTKFLKRDAPDHTKDDDVKHRKSE
ncbi:N2,N2-dimethylguanosine tRNA methyltransferase-domain-containing protein [Dipodascopsis tothii]|uniref:N2,N2-dimethylguanosine tRNA methyltransferase-domain-containing protein n=1 Tax=Dipodascopsis tothii TaxID=44089 RepID=UPI0034CD31D3